MPSGGEIVPDPTGGTRGRLYFCPVSNTYTYRTVDGERAGFNLVVGAASGKPNITTYLGVNTMIALDYDSLRDHLKHLYFEFRYNGAPLNTQGYDTPLDLQMYNQRLLEIETFQAAIPRATPLIGDFPIIDMAIRYMGPAEGSPQMYRTRRDDTQAWTLIQNIVIPNYSQPYLEHIDNDDFLLRFDFDFTDGTPSQIPIAAIAPDPPRNRLLMGAPGTGKSRQLSDAAISLVETTGGTDEFHVFRISFNPSTTYGKFMGELRPSMIFRESGSGTYVNTSGVEINDPEIPGFPVITYKFNPGVFLRAYQRAREDEDQPVVLLIDEINRADIYEVFGEVFQLMERLNDGTGEYTDNSLMEEAFEYLEEDSITLPPNLYIWATMNPNDASVQIIDSAFIRRWTTEYYGINRGDNNNNLEVPVLACGWERLRTCINQKLIAEKFDEGELLGKWFIKETDRSTWERFYSKVIFHLANFVVKEDLEVLFSQTTVREIMAACEDNTNPFNDSIRQCMGMETLLAEEARLAEEERLAQEDEEAPDIEEEATIVEEQERLAQEAEEARLAEEASLGEEGGPL